MRGVGLGSVVGLELLHHVRPRVNLARWAEQYYGSRYRSTRELLHASGLISKQKDRGLQSVVDSKLRRRCGWGGTPHPSRARGCGCVSIIPHTLQTWGMHHPHGSEFYAAWTRSRLGLNDAEILGQLVLSAPFSRRELNSNPDRLSLVPGNAP